MLEKQQQEVGERPGMGEEARFSHQGNDKDLGGKPLLDLKQDYFLLRWGNTFLPKVSKINLRKQNSSEGIEQRRFDYSHQQP